MSLALAAVAITACAAACAQGLSVRLPRHVYLRGEEIPVTVATDAPTAGVVEAFLDDRRVGVGALRDGAAELRAATGDLKVGAYTLRVVARDATAAVEATEAVTIARRPPGDRLEVWLWSVGGADCTHYFDHGFTIAGGPYARGWKADYRDGYVKSLDSRLARGVYATIGPCGGILRSELPEVDPTAPDVAYRGAGREEENYLNPFAPEVEAARRARNDAFLGDIADHPAVKVAFYNTELVDDLWLDNLNARGAELTQQRLGFTRDDRGDPQFVAPGVIANDDRGYRFLKHCYTEGNGLAYANRRTAEDVKSVRGDLLTLTDPYRSVAFPGMFPGMDLVGTWTYTNPDPKLMLYVETMRAATRGTGQTPLQTVTLLNYPGTLVPRSVTGDAAWGEKERSGWLLMGPDRCKEVSWIILSRAPRVIGYYFSSACDPEKFAGPEDQARVPHATSDAIQELSERVYRPLGKLITRLQVAPRKIAVLSSQASRLYGKSPRTIGYPNEQIYGFYSAMAMAHLNADVLFDEHLEQGALAAYDVLALPYCPVMTEAMCNEVLRFVERGGLVVADQHLGPDVPGAVKLDFDFTYRLKVNADAIESGVMFADWDDHLNPQTAKLAEAKGITAEEDQRIMEAYARQLAEALAGRVEPEVTADSPRALVNVLQGEGVTYLAVVNDNRGPDERSGAYQAMLEKLDPLTTTLTVRAPRGPLFAYDLTAGAALPVRQDGDTTQIPVTLTDLGGTLVALYPVEPATLEVEAPAGLRCGEVGALTLRITDRASTPLPGLQPLRVTVTDAEGRDTEYSDYYCAEGGRLVIPLKPAANDLPGTWRVEAEDLTAGLSAAATFEVSRP